MREEQTMENVADVLRCELIIWKGQWTDTVGGGLPRDARLR